LNQAARDKADRFLTHLAPIQRSLSAYCRRALSDISELEDGLQSAVTNAYRDFDLYAEGTNFRAWIFRYVTLETLNRNRAAARRRAVGQLPDEPSVDDRDASGKEWTIEQLLDDPELVLEHCDEAIAAAVYHLPDTERSIFLLRAIGEFKYREIAEILEVPVGTVMGLLSRGRDRIRRSLAEYGRKHGLLPGRDSQ